jgi:hypothetical protein
MDSKIKILFLLLVSPILLFAQNKAAKKYVDSSELQLKLFASSMFYSEQINIADTNANKKTVDYFGSKYFQESNYSQPAIDTIMAYSKREAHKDFDSDKIGKCLCYTSSLLFFTSDKLNQKVKSLRKYLSKQAAQ